MIKEAFEQGWQAAVKEHVPPQVPDGNPHWHDELVRMSDEDWKKFLGYIGDRRQVHHAKTSEGAPQPLGHKLVDNLVKTL